MRNETEAGMKWFAVVGPQQSTQPSTGAEKRNREWHERDAIFRALPDAKEPHARQGIVVRISALTAV